VVIGVSIARYGGASASFSPADGSLPVFGLVVKEKDRISRVSLLSSCSGGLKPAGERGR